MRVLSNRWWWLAVIVFVVHQIGERYLGWQLGQVDNYLDPFLAVPILLGLWLLERQLIFRVPRLSGLETALATVVLALIFEEVYPIWEEGFIRDGADYIFYGLGGLYFYFLVNRP